MFLGGQGRVVLPVVSKTTCRESDRVQLLYHPPLEDKPFRKRHRLLIGRNESLGIETSVFRECPHSTWNNEKSGV